MIACHELVKQFGSRRAVDALTLNVAAGETFGLLGPNGAGKTTTISMIAGLLRPDAGTVTIDGRNPFAASTRASLGVVPQALAVYEDLTAAENLRFFGKLYGLGGGMLRRRVAWTLELAGLVDRATERVRTFSGGMKRRLNIAVALMHEPRLLLLDEPTVGVDPQSRNHILDTIRTLAAEGLTILYTTHYMEEAQKLCDRVAIIDHGQLLAIDSVPELIRAHGGDSTLRMKLAGEVSHRQPAAQQVGDTWQMHTRAPVDELRRLQEDGFQFAEVQILQPDLEGVFLALTGRSLRD